MSNKGLILRIIVYFSVLAMLIFFIISKQEAILLVRASTVVSPITEWAKTGKPVDILCVKRTDFYTFAKLTVEKASDNQYIGYITQEAKESFSLGQKVYYNANKRMLCGNVVDISSERDFDKGLFKVIVDLGESKQHLNSREVVFVHTGSVSDVIQLPNEVLDLVEGKMFVNKIMNGTLQRVYVALGDYGRETVIIVKGVNEGDRIIIKGSALVAQGERVFVRKEISQ